ncbi:M14 family metallopeptidase [Desulfosoma caldarium]|uniref:Zinc carboxypeptidase n=1 Tax=Desulfosoma caldarium TaxID=610254 RepID=A0A3N1V014_9BACT|nr:M14 family metallopeptidase [Desulfosoma caldarium]ROQ93451.1 zinc carboxypeptidase [Desulfosoma caldarium]
MLAQLFARQKIYEDTDADGVIDRVTVRLVLPRNLSWSVVWAEAAHVACRWAFDSVRLEAPLVRFRGPQGPQPHLVVRLPAQAVENTPSPSPVRLVRQSLGRVVATGQSPEAIASFLRLLAVCDALDLPNLPETWSVLQWLPDTQVLMAWNTGDLKKPCLTHKISQAKAALLDLSCPPVKRHQSLNPKNAPNLLNLSSPHGIFETLEEDPRQRSLSLTVALPSPRLSPRLGWTLCHVLSRLSLEATQIHIPFISLAAADQHGIVLELREKTWGDKALVRFAEKNCRHLILEGSGASLERALKGWLLWAVREPGPEAEPIEALRDKVQLITRLVKRSAPVQSEASHSPLIRECQWIAEDLRLEKLVRRLPSGSGPLRGTVFVSKPEPVRYRLKARLEKILKAKGYQPSLEVYNAYKPGLCWLLEKVLPALRDLHNDKDACVHTLELSFSPFRGPEGSMETRTRWLQEIYPGPDLLAQSLEWDVSKIRLRMDPVQQDTYRVRAWNPEGQLLLHEALTPRCSALPYFGQLEHAGTVHPTTSGLRLMQGSHIVLDRSIPTDREVFWRVFGKRWLPALWKSMERRLSVGSPARLRAFWKEIRIDVRIEETEKALGLDQERLSPMEALHEDLYFTILEAYKEFAARHDLCESLQLGQVMPFVAWKSPGGHARARLEAQPFAESIIHPLACVQSVPQGSADAEEEPRISWLRCHKRHWDMALALSPPACPQDQHQLGNILSRLGLDGVLSNTKDHIVLRCPAPRPPRSLPKAREREVMDPPPTDRLLAFRDVARWVRKLSSLPGLKAWQAAKTFQGRPVWALEATLPSPSQTVSRSRLRLIKPTLVFNARHHANEVSSTEAALFSAWTAVSTNEGRTLLQKLNLAWIPLENADGVAAFERLHLRASGHKLHAARYNALGCEFYEDYFLERPRFPEALAKRRVWERWLPEMILDGHGVPSHEWDQPFSGYLPGVFAEHWIPRAFLYVYLPYLDAPENPNHPWALQLARNIQRHVQDEAELVQKNEELRARYHRYAERWEPKIFPSVMQGPAALLPPVPRVAQFHYSAQQPHITYLEVVTEVADEVAQGPWLDLCVRGHLAVWKAMIEVLQAHAPKTITTAKISGRRVRFSWRCESVNLT